MPQKFYCVLTGEPNRNLFMPLRQPSPVITFPNATFRDCAQAQVRDSDYALAWIASGLPTNRAQSRYPSSRCSPSTSSDLWGLPRSS